MSEQLALFSPHEMPEARGIDFLEIHRDAEITEDPGGATFRWWLKRWWRAGPMVCWIMLNPSRADAKIDDPTLLRVMDFTHAWGFGGLAVVNLMPYRSSSPAIAGAWLRNARNADKLLASNTEIVLEHAAAAELRIAAWGNPPGGEIWQHAVDRIYWRLCELGVHCLGTTLNGMPKHPLARGRHRISRDQKPIIWRLPDEGY